MKEKKRKRAGPSRKKASGRKDKKNTASGILNKMVP